MTEITTIGAGQLEALIAAALVASNTSVANAASVARALAQAEIDGQKGHGLSRVPIYAAQAKAGKVDGHATPTVRQTRPGSLMIDVADGFVFPAVDLAVAHLPAMAGATGIAAAGFVRSHHFGVVGRHVERLAEMGLLALAFANTPKAMAPWGGRQPLFGTNPLAFAAPQRSKPPIVVDLALSQVARGKILTAAQKGEPIPAGWAVDDEGNPDHRRQGCAQGCLAADRRRQRRGAGADGGGPRRGADRRALLLRSQLLLRRRRVNRPASASSSSPSMRMLSPAARPSSTASPSWRARSRPIRAPACRARDGSPRARRRGAKVWRSTRASSPRYGPWPLRCR